MERRGKMTEITVAGPDVAPASGSVGVAIYEVNKQAGKEPSTPGTPSPATAWRGSDGRRAEGDNVGPLPGWKVDCLCGESSLPPAVKGGFLCF
ncbi:hypothetical protein SETIT_3G077600v2 [Setaria italica]|uniref:Uncharacterized protein n=2 Tax=Setaria TaxID=4554 RepID=K3ZB73_SETIT|nr:hypothetical protein SETIT_3G077600v2 [Setaria italica]TKW24887.1 hypothetical protein SEVIR_3G079400v2 [Setaria viridis]